MKRVDRELQYRGNVHRPFIPLCGISFETPSTQRIPVFSFTVEGTVNENHQKLRFIMVSLFGYLDVSGRII